MSNSVWQVMLYLTLLLVWSVIAGGLLGNLRIFVDPFLVDASMCFITTWLGVSLFAETSGTTEIIELKLQLIIDLMVHICKMLHEMSKKEKKQCFLTPTTQVTGWMRDFKSETNVDLLRKKYT